MMIKKSQSKFSQLLFYVMVFVGLLFVAQIAIGLPLFKSTNKLRNEFKAKQRILQESEQLIRDIPNPQKSIEDIEKKADEFKNMEVTKKQLPRLINLLGKSVNEFNIDLVSIKPREDIKAGDENLPTGVTKVYIEIVLSCPYRIFGDYISSLSKLPVVFIIENIELRKSEKEESAISPGKKVLGKSDEKTEDLLITLVVSTYMVLEI